MAGYLFVGIGQLPPYLLQLPNHDVLVDAPADEQQHQNAARKQLTICEREIAKAEEQLAALDRAMEEHACDYEQLRALCEEKDAAQAALDKLYEQWDALAEEAEG